MLPLVNTNVLSYVYPLAEQALSMLTFGNMGRPSQPSASIRRTARQQTHLTGPVQHASPDPLTTRRIPGSVRVQRKTTWHTGCDKADL